MVTALIGVAACLLAIDEVLVQHCYLKDILHKRPGRSFVEKDIKVVVTEDDLRLWDTMTNEDKVSAFRRGLQRKQSHRAE
jgi:hypothetical protein